MPLTRPYTLSASILSADFAHLADDIRAMENAGVSQIHFDVMDFHFVPNLTLGAMFCQALREAGITSPIDVHLMVDEPLRYIEPFAKAGANLITFHPETVSDVGAAIDAIHKAGLGAGLAFNPDKPVQLSPAYLQQLEMILIMSVYPGFGGQAFMPEVLPKIQALRAELEACQSTAYLAVDGGVKLENIAEVAQSGADFFVLGSGLFNTEDYALRVQQLKMALEGV